MFPTNFTLDIAGQSSNYTILIGGNNFDESGWSVSSIGDLNDDGIPDLLIGAIGVGNDKGATYVVSGASINLNAGGSISLNNYATPGAGIVRFVGENNLDCSGYSVSSIGDLNGDGIPDLLIGAPGYPGCGTSCGATYVVSGAALNSYLSHLPDEVFSVDEIHQHKIIDTKNIDEINMDGRQLYIRDAENADTQLHRAVRNTEDDSFSLRTQPMWHDLPIIHPAQIPLIQVGVHIVKNFYDMATRWFQGRNAETVTATQELISTEQVIDALTGYNNISNKLASIIQQLELDRSTDKALVSWYKELLADHQEQGKQLLDEPVINQELLSGYYENIEVFAKDLSEFAQQQVNDDLALSYIKAELAEVNQALANLATISLDTAESVELLDNLHEQPPADNTQSMIFANAIDTNIYDTAMLNNSLLMLGEVS